MITDNSQTVRVAIYPRVSRDEQVAGYSLDAQRDACRVYADAHGWAIVREFVEPGISATTVDKRPAFQAMITFALAGGCDVVLVHKYDRLNRNRFDALLYKRMLREKGIAVVSATEPGAEDGPAGVLVEGMLEVVAEWYSTNLAAEVKKGLRRKAASGQRPSGGLPLGYQYQRDGDSSWVAVTEQGAWVADAFTEFATGRYTLRSWAEEAWQRGYRRNGKRIAPNRWADLLHNRFYIGVIVYDGEEYQGRHVALVDEDTFVKVQRLLLERPGGNRRAKREYLFSGLLFSIEHKRTLTAMGAKGGRYRYYCIPDAEPALYIREEEIERQLADHLARVNVNGVDLASFPPTIRLALQVAPCVGAVYEALDEEGDRRSLLNQVVTRIRISGQEIVSLDLADGFEFNFQQSGQPDSNPGHPLILATFLYAEVTNVA